MSKVQNVHQKLEIFSKPQSTSILPHGEIQIWVM